MPAYQRRKKLPRVTIYTDGACGPTNPGPGGYAAIVMYEMPEDPLSDELPLTKAKALQGHTDLVFGGGPETTNNRMELAAPIVALEALKKPCSVVLYSDSQYVLKGITEWIKKWKKNGWKKSNKEPVENRDLWERLDRAAKKHDIAWKWVKGHSDDESEQSFWNSFVDMLAVNEKEKAQREVGIQ